MAELRRLEDNYRKGPREAFEDLATLLFCTHLGLSAGVNRRVNQKGIESDPVTIEGKVYAYQAKYYDAATSLCERKNDVIESIKVARQRGVTDLLFFVNKNLGENSRTGGEPQYIKEINEAARGRDGEPEVRLDWWSLSKIESTLDIEGYLHIRKTFLGEDDDERRLAAFYDYICDQFDGDRGNELYGDIPLRDSYIEPMVKGEDGSDLSVREYIERWLEDSDNRIAILCGEPGHGKTSLCRKAVRDFHRDGWLAGKVSNVFCFSLNPARTDALTGNDLDFYSLLSWGNNRRSSKYKIDEENCKNALVLLDGFDELLEWYPRFDLKKFIEEYVIGFQSDSDAYVLVTSRSMVVEPDKKIYTIGSHTRVPIVRLQPVSREQQIAWIEKYAEYCRDTPQIEIGASSIDSEDDSGQMLEELSTYLNEYRKLPEDADLKSILGIPIIFRMYVAARLLPDTGKSITRKYDDLFEATWDRHRHHDANVSEDLEAEAKKRLSHHALMVYLNKGDTAEVEGILDSSWLFSFYTTHEGERRVGFLHRSFYQFFLAHEILSWFREYADGCDEDAFRSRLSYLARRKLDETTLSYFKDMYEGDENHMSLDDAFNKAYTILKETDGILEIPRDENNAVKIGVVAPLERANNVFWNAVSLCSICGKELSVDKVGDLAIRIYNLEGAILWHSKLDDANLCGAHLSRSHLDGSHLSEADLSRADLSEAHLHGARLEKTFLCHSQLVDTDFSKADLSEANLIAADADEAIFRGAKLFKTNLMGADLKDADFSDASLRRANLVTADLCDAYLGDADLRDANLSRANLRRADFNGADLEGADLSEAVLYGADFSNTDFRNVRYERTTLDGTILDETIFDDEADWS